MLAVEGLFYWSTFLEHNPHFQPFLSRHFERGRVGQRLLHTLFAPHPAVRAMRDEWLRTVGRPRVSLQVRNDNQPRTHPQVSAAEWRSYIACGRSLSGGGAGVWFVATDSAASRDIAAVELKGLSFKFNDQAFLPGRLQQCAVQYMSYIC